MIANGGNEEADNGVNNDFVTIPALSKNVADTRFYQEFVVIGDESAALEEMKRNLFLIEGNVGRCGGRDVEIALLQNMLVHCTNSWFISQMKGLQENVYNHEYIKRRLKGHRRIKHYFYSKDVRTHLKSCKKNRPANVN